LDFRRDDLRELVFADCAVVDLAPFTLRLVVNVKVAIPRWHWIGWDLRAANSRKNMRDLGHAFLDLPFGDALLFDAPLDVNATRSEHHHRESPFIEFGDEIGAQPRE